MLRETENALHELIVVKGKYLSGPQLFEKVVSLLNNAPRASLTGGLQREIEPQGSCCCNFRCLKQKCTGCLKWIGKCCVFMCLLVGFTGLVAFLFGAGQ